MNFRDFRRWGWRFFAGAPWPTTTASPSEVQHQVATNQLMVRAFYFFIGFLAIISVKGWPRTLQQINLIPLWPTSWISFVPTTYGILAIHCLYLGSCVLTMIFPGSRLLRFITFLGIFQWISLDNSLGKISHSMHLVVFVAFIFIFLPQEWDHRALMRQVRVRLAQTIWAAQALILLTYTMAGISKIVASLHQVAHGEVSYFHPLGLPWVIAGRLALTGSDSFLGAWFIERPWLCWPMMLGAIYLEFFSFWILFRPKLYAWWALGLILFHLASYFTMTILFSQSTFLLALFFTCAAARSQPFNLRELVVALPLFGPVLRRLWCAKSN